MSRNIKILRKKIISKLRLIQNRALRRITNIYKTTFTKVLQIKINISSINMHFKKLI